MSTRLHVAKGVRVPEENRGAQRLVAGPKKRSHFFLLGFSASGLPTRLRLFDAAARPAVRPLAVLADAAGVVSSTTTDSNTRVGGGCFTEVVGFLAAGFFGLAAGGAFFEDVLDLGLPGVGVFFTPEVASGGILVKKTRA